MKPLKPVGLTVGIYACCLLITLLPHAATAPPTCSSTDGTTCATLSKDVDAFFPNHIPSKIPYEGPSSTNPLAFKFYNADEKINGKTMREWLRFSLAFWHTIRGDGSDPFGSATKAWPWETTAREQNLSPLALAKLRLDVFFNIINRLDVDFWCFHDRDIADVPENASVEEANQFLDAVVQHAQGLQKKHQKKLLWGTAQLFKHPRYMNGAATSPNATVFAYSAAQAKAALEATVRLEGEAFVFWGGREGYATLLNTDMKLEQDNAARFLKMAAQHAKKLGWKGGFMLEPKPQEPTKHQYDWDAATTHAFLLSHGLTSFKRPDGSPLFTLNIECNHAQLSKHSCFHDLTYASNNGLLASLDANTGDPHVGWDTDEFLTDPKEATLVALAILRNGGLSPGGVNFDAKLRRESTDVEDILVGHISGMDTLARGLRNAAAIDGWLKEMVDKRYSSYKESDIGRKVSGDKTKTSWAELSEWVIAREKKHGVVERVESGKQELYEMLFNNMVR